MPLLDNVRNVSIRAIFIFLALTQIVACSGEQLARSIANDASTEQRTEPQETIETATINNVSLSWAAPSERENNEPIALSEIAGYKIYYGTSARDYTDSVNIEDGAADGYTFESLNSGTYYFALTTYDTAGRESQYSAEIKIII